MTDINKLMYYNSDVVMLGNGFIVDSIEHISITIFEKFIGMLSNFAAMIADPRTTVKRSDFKTYCDNNVISYRAINNASYTDIYKVQIPIFKGMQNTYPVVLNTLSVCLKSLNILSSANTAYATITDIKGLIDRREPLLDIIKKGSTVYDATVNSSIRKSLHGVLDIQDNTVTSVFSNHFKSMKEFTDTKDRVLNIIVEYRTADKVYSTMKNIETTVTEIIHIIAEDKIIISNNDLSAISQLIRTYANMFEVYAVLLHRLENIDHNMVEVYKAIDRVIKK